jgi:hypothetical protein
MNKDQIEKLRELGLIALEIDLNEIWILSSKFCDFWKKE